MLSQLPRQKGLVWAQSAPFGGPGSPWRARRTRFGHYCHWLLRLCWTHGYHTLWTNIGPLLYGMSVMHYSQYAFGNGQRTIQTLDPSKQNVIGNVRGVSNLDIEIMRKMYGCGVDVCNLPSGAGASHCKAYFPRWTFSKERGCYHFVYGGCRGNANSFKTRA